jgi:hypothetical protein
MSDAEHGQPALKRARVEVGMDDSRAKKLGFEIGIAIEQLNGLAEKQIPRTVFHNHPGDDIINKRTCRWSWLSEHTFENKTVLKSMYKMPMLFGPDREFDLSSWSDVVPFLVEMQEILKHADKFPDRMDIVVGAIDNVFTDISLAIAGLVVLTDTEHSKMADSLVREYLDFLQRAARHGVFFEIRPNEFIMQSASYAFQIVSDDPHPPSSPETLPPPDTHLSVPRPHPGPRPGPRPGGGIVPL